MKYFGTDGIRSKVGKLLTADLALAVGKATGAILFKRFKEAGETRRPFIVVGKDPRLTSDMLETAIIAGFTSRGINVLTMGVTPTPAVAYATRQLGAKAGVMISASHNPYYDNGIKIFGHDGFKVRDDIEAEIEDILNYPEKIWNYPVPDENEIGIILDNEQANQKYINYIKNTVDTDFSDFHVALDCANGATSHVAPQLFSLLGAKVSVMGNHPNGININANVGSTHPDALAAFVKEVGADIGFSFDGDGDRVIAIDEFGEVRDGDYILFLCGQYLKEKGRLNQNTIVSTIMANLGFHQGLEEIGIHSIQTDVGDRFVAQAMLQGGYALGGEQSGHVIFLEYSTTGDGLLTAVQLLNVVKARGVGFARLTKMMKKLPQLLVNLKVNDKQQIFESPLLKEKQLQLEEALAGRGRLLLRPSGTEPLIRVMVEAETEEICRDIAHQVLDVIKKIINN